MNNRNKCFYLYNLYNKSGTIYIGLQPVSKHQLGLFVRFQPLGHQPCLIKAPTLDLGAPTPRTPILPILRHQPQGLRSYLVNASTLDLGAPTPRTPILPISRHQPQGLWPYLVKNCFDRITLLSKCSSLCSVNLELHYSLHATSSMTTCLHMKESSQLFILPTQSLQSYLMMILNSHYDLQ